ncbi:MAG: FISUMP domain-containing protein [Bacteroidales bacterium]
MNKRIVISVFFYLVMQGFAFGQGYGQNAESFQKPAFSVLWNNADLTNKKLLVEIMYEKNTCFQDAAEFWMHKKDEPTGGRRVKIDSLLNNQKNCTVSADSFTLSNPTAGGYRLRFALTDADTIASDSVRIRVVSKYQTFFSCKGCGAADSDVTIDSTSIHPDCPYNNINFDLLACSKRTGGANNWEGFMVDHRDCKIYRMVAMPHIRSYNKGAGRWWLAQSLNYTKNLIMNRDATVNAGIGSYWCIGAASFDGRSRPVAEDETTISGGEVACNTYGAFYPFATVISRNGMAPVQDPSTGVNSYSLAQGICPSGWVIPGRKDWGVMFNKIAGCTDDNLAQTPVASSSTTNAPCHHLSNATEAGVTSQPPMISVNLPASLRSILSSKQTLKADSIFITATKPLWPWYGVGTKRQHGARPIDYYGFSILPGGLVHTDKYCYQAETNFWTSTSSSTTHERVALYYSHSFMTIMGMGSTSGLPFRCVRSYSLDE